MDLSNLVTSLIIIATNVQMSITFANIITTYDINCHFLVFSHIGSTGMGESKLIPSPSVRAI